jgi:hypothetical protein
MQSIDALQREMRGAFLHGAPGMLVSAGVWLLAGIVCARTGMHAAVWTLLVGGALIHPVSTLALKLAGKSARAPEGSALTHLAMATTVWLIVGCVLSYGLYTANPAWFFPAMLLVIGSRYLAFQTLFGHRLYWVCGAALIAAGWLCASAGISPAATAFVGSAVEGAFAGILLLSARRTAA